MNHQPNIEIHIRRCYACGRFYGVEAERLGGCPICAEDDKRALRAEVDGLKRSVAAYKGALKRRSAKK